jgi:CheY-like chemotaxis protein
VVDATNKVPLILVVDDDADARAAMRDALEGHGYNVVEADNGRTALKYLSSDSLQPSVAVLDLHMPEMSGWELMVLMKMYKKLSGIPVVITTGSESTHDFVRKGVAAYLRKPVRDDLLFQTVERALRKSEATDED